MLIPSQLICYPNIYYRTKSKDSYSDTSVSKYESLYGKEPKLRYNAPPLQAKGAKSQQAGFNDATIN